MRHSDDLAPLNLITDVPGIAVGHAHDGKALSGVTVALIARPNVASVVTRGGAPGTRDTTLLEPAMTVEAVDAFVLSGGSVYGLDAAGGVLSCLRSRDIGHAVGSIRVPIVPQAIIFDLLNGGNKSWSRPPYWDLGFTAATQAGAGPFALGSVGGGYGATTATFKGGVGSTSAVTSGGVRVGALAIVNALGSATVGDGPAFWAGAFERDGEFGGVPFPGVVSPADLVLRVKGGAPPSTTIALVATDARLSKPQVKRLAHMADDGLARALRPAHAGMDGDTVFAVSCPSEEHPPVAADLTEIGMLAGDCLARAIARGVFEADIPSESYTGPPAYKDRHANTSEASGQR